MSGHINYHTEQQAYILSSELKSLLNFPCFIFPHHIFPFHRTSVPCDTSPRDAGRTERGHSETLVKRPRGCHSTHHWKQAARDLIQTDPENGKHGYLQLRPHLV